MPPGTSFFSACATMLPMFRLLTRCAPQAALISLQGTPHTFSVYDLKNCRYSARPKRLMKKSSSDCSGVIGARCDAP